MAAVLALFVACGRADHSVPRAAKLGPGIVAAVGDDGIAATTVTAIAAARHTTLRAARDAAISDALFAAEARLALPGEWRAAETRALSRALLEAVGATAQAPPISEAELEERTRWHFIEVDRPAGFRVVHAVVLVGDKAGSEERGRARAHAEEIRRLAEPVVRAAAGSPAPKRRADEMFVEKSDMLADAITASYQQLVTKLDHGGLDTRFEYLGVVCADGRTLDASLPPSETPTMVAEFARAAAELGERGELSPVVETEIPQGDVTLHGYHVIALLERTPELRLSRAERLARLGAEIQRVRARKALAVLLDGLRSATRVEVGRNVDSLLAEIPAAGSAPAQAP